MSSSDFNSHAQISTCIKLGRAVPFFMLFYSPVLLSSLFFLSTNHTVATKMGSIIACVVEKKGNERRTGVGRHLTQDN